VSPITPDTPWPDLVRRAQQGERAAFDEIVLRTWSRLLGYTVVLTSKNLEDAKDALNTVFARTWEKFGRYTEQGKFEAFMHTAIKWELNNRWKARESEIVTREKAEQMEKDEPEAKKEAVIESSLLESDDAGQMEAALRTLTVTERDLVELIHFDDCTPEEAEAELGLAPGEARAMLRRIKPRLAKAGAAAGSPNR
jgi:RNA polymerase sigma factor (sigma-70 family)